MRTLWQTESTGAMDEAIQKYIKDGYMQPIGEDLISRQGAIDAFGLSEKTRKYGGDHSGYNTMMLYEIQDVLESIPSAPDSRQRGEWVWNEDAVDWGIGAWVCNKCGSRPQTWWSTDRNKNPLIWASSRFCGNCGAYMGGQNND